MKARDGFVVELVETVLGLVAAALEEGHQARCRVPAVLLVERYERDLRPKPVAADKGVACQPRARAKSVERGGKAYPVGMRARMVTRP